MKLMNKYDDHYQFRLKQGQMYEDFIKKQLCKLGMHFNVYSTREYQFAEGEGTGGAEVKLDDRMASTGNLWIECKEKATQRGGSYAWSGTARPNIMFWIQGDYSFFFIFTVAVLRDVIASGEYEFRENKTKTSVGIWLPVNHAARIGEKIDCSKDGAVYEERNIEFRRRAYFALQGQPYKHWCRKGECEYHDVKTSDGRWKSECKKCGRLYGYYGPKEAAKRGLT